MDNFNTPILTWLAKQGITKVKWDTSTNTLFVNEKPFMNMDSGLFTLKEGKLYSNEDTLTSELKKFFANLTTQNQAPSIGRGGQYVAPIIPKTPTPAVTTPAPTAPTVQPVTTVTAPEGKVWIRDWLNKQGYTDEQITYDPKTKTVLLNGVPFIGQTFISSIENGHAFSDPMTLTQQLSQWKSKNEGTATANVPPETPPPTASDVFNLQEQITNAGLTSQLGSYDSILKLINDNTNAIGQKILDVFGNLTDSALKNLEISYNTQKTALESQKGQVSANYAGAINKINQAIMSSRARTKEDMAARGLLFSGLLTRALSQVEATGVEQKSEVYQKEAADLNTIASQLAVLTSNYAISQDQTKQNYLAQEGLKMLDLLTTDANQKLEIAKLQADIQNQIDLAKATVEPRKKLYEIQAKQAEAEAQAKAEQQDFENWIKEQGVEARWAEIGVSQDQLTEKVNEFNQTFSLDVNKNDFSQWYQTQQLNLQTAVHNLNVSKFNADQQKAITDATNTIASTPLDSVLKMNTEELTAFLGKLKGLKVTTTEGLTTTTNFPVGFESATKLEGMALSLLSLSQVSGNLDIADNMTQFQTIVKTIAPSLNPDQVGLIVDNYIKDPLAKVYAHILFAAKGDINQMGNILYSSAGEINNWLTDLGINTPEYRAKLYQLVGISGGR